MAPGVEWKTILVGVYMEKLAYMMEVSDAVPESLVLIATTLV
jgi:hypothetical protein